MKYTEHQDQLAKLELLINNTYAGYEIDMSRKNRLQLIEKILEGRA
jgi:hypothetical protein